MAEKITNKEILEKFAQVNNVVDCVDKFVGMTLYNTMIPIKDMGIIRNNFSKIMELIATMTANNYFCFTATQRNQMLDTMKMLNKYWADDDKELFMINWIVFMDDWKEMVYNMYDLLDDDKINRISLN